MSKKNVSSSSSCFYNNKQTHQRVQENRERFFSLLQEGARLIEEQSFDDGLKKLTEARLYATPQTPMATELEEWISRAESEIREILEIEADWLENK